MERYDISARGINISAVVLAWILFYSISIGSGISILQNSDQKSADVKDSGVPLREANADLADFLSLNRLRIQSNDDSEGDNPLLSDDQPESRSIIEQERKMEGRLVSADEHSMVLANASTVLCQNGFISVSVNKTVLASVAGAATEEQLSFRDTYDESCKATSKASNRTHFVLATLTSLCLTSTGTQVLSDGKKVQMVKNQVIFRPKPMKLDKSYSDSFSSPSVMVVNVTCSKYVVEPEYANIPAPKPPEPKIAPSLPVISNPVLPPPLWKFDAQDSGATNQSFRMTVSDKMWVGPNADTSWVKHPFEVTVGSWIYAQIQIVQPSNDDDLKAHAKECFFSKNSDPAKEPKWPIITSGCPRLNTVTLHHSKSLPTNRYTRVSFKLEKIYFDSMYMYFQCKVVACSLGGGREQEGYETCPNSSACSDRVVDTRHAPMESPYAYVSSGLMRPILKPDPDLSESGAECPPCPTVPSTAQPQQAPEIILISGVSVPMVIGIAVGSFIIGLILMGGLWYVHEHTEPKKYLNAKRRNSDRDSLSFSSAPMPHAATPMTRNPARNGIVVINGTAGV